MAFDTLTCWLLQWWIERCSRMRTPTQTCPACQARRNTSTCRKSRGYAASWQGSSPSTTHKPSPRTLAHPKWPNFPKTYVSLGGGGALVWLVSSAAQGSFSRWTMKRFVVVCVSVTHLWAGTEWCACDQWPEFQKRAAREQPGDWTAVSEMTAAGLGGLVLFSGKGHGCCSTSKSLFFSLIPSSFSPSSGGLSNPVKGGQWRE